jgi:hypothetical protein
VISRNYDLVPIWLFSEPIVEVFDDARPAREKGYVAGMDEQVARGQINLSMEVMAIGDTRNNQGKSSGGSQGTRIPVMFYRDFRINGYLGPGSGFGPIYI